MHSKSWLSTQKEASECYPHIHLALNVYIFTLLVACCRVKTFSVWVLCVCVSKWTWGSPEPGESRYLLTQVSCVAANCCSPIWTRCCAFTLFGWAGDVQLLQEVQKEFRMWNASGSKLPRSLRLQRGGLRNRQPINQQLWCVGSAFVSARGPSLALRWPSFCNMTWTPSSGHRFLFLELKKGICY